MFGDFGMSCLIGEEWGKKTWTKFAGTPRYCSSEMKALMGGEQGYVDLYLNDFNALQETIR